MATLPVIKPSSSSSNPPAAKVTRPVIKPSSKSHAAPATRPVIKSSSSLNTPQDAPVTRPVIKPSSSSIAQNESQIGASVISPPPEYDSAWKNPALKYNPKMVKGVINKVGANPKYKDKIRELIKLYFTKHNQTSLPRTDKDVDDMIQTITDYRFNAALRLWYPTYVPCANGWKIQEYEFKIGESMVFGSRGMYPLVDDNYVKFIAEHCTTSYVSVFIVHKVDGFPPPNFWELLEEHCSRRP